MTATEQLCLRVPPDLKSGLVQAAGERNVSVNALCGDLLAIALDIINDSDFDVDETSL